MTDAGANYGPEPQPFVPRPQRRLLNRAVPVTAQLDGYARASFGKDALAGLTVMALAIPSAMGFAEVAGLPPVAGLYALLLPVVAYAVLGTSRQLVVGPEGTSAALVATAVAPLAGGDPVLYAALAGMLALLVGGGFLLARIVRLGWVADYLSRAALVGFVHGVVVVLICGQLGKVTGVTIEADKPVGQVIDLLKGIDTISLATLGVATVAVGLLVGFRRLWPKLPGPLIVVVGAIAVSATFDLAAHGVATLGQIPSGLPGLELPRVSLADVLHLAPAALGIVFATFSDSILTARSFAGRHDQHVNANQELLALGVANLTAGVSQGFAMGNSNSRTAVNDQMGVRTQVAGFVSAAAVALVLLFLTEPIAYLPVAVLGAVIIVAAAGLVAPEDWRGLARVGRAEVVIASAAVAGVVLLGVLEGILIAVALSILDVVRRSARPHDAVLGWVPRLGRYGDVALHTSAELTPGLVIYRLDDRLFFANATYVKGRVREAIAGSPTAVKRVVFDTEALTEVDSTGVEELGALVRSLRRQGVAFSVARLKAQMRDIFDAAGLTAEIGTDEFFPTVRAAVEAPSESDPDDGGPVTH